MQCWYPVPAAPAEEVMELLRQCPAGALPVPVSAPLYGRQKGTGPGNGPLLFPGLISYVANYDPRRRIRLLFKEPENIEPQCIGH